MSDKRGRWRLPAWFWVPSTYFAEGFPYALVNTLSERLFEQLGASPQLIGMTASFHLPWNLKLLWGPVLDEYSTKRRWMVGAEIALLVGVIFLAFLVAAGQLTLLIGVVFFALGLFAALHDTAIDGYYLDALDEDDQAKYVGLRVPPYRGALILVSGPLLAQIGWMTELFSPALAWSLGLGSCAGVLALLVLLHGLGLPRLVKKIETRAGPSSQGRLSRRYRVAVRSFFAQPRVWAILAFVILFRTGESFLQKMRWVFLHRECGVTLLEDSLLNGTIGMVAALVATAAAGALIAKQGLRRWIWPCVLSQNLLNLLYAGLAAAPDPSTTSLTTVGVVVVAEQVGSGFGTAVLFVYIMRCCDPEHSAAHMALLTSVMSLGFTFAGMTSGFLAEAMGYRDYFLMTFVATIPSMLLIFVIPHLRERSGEAL